MDRADARYVADVLTARLEGDEQTLRGFLRMPNAAMRLRALAADLGEIADTWAPALIGKLELDAIADQGLYVLEHPAPSQLGALVASLAKLAGEPALPPQPVNRHDRRARAKLHLPRRDRILQRSVH